MCKKIFFTKNHFIEINGLRGLSILLVLIFHYFPSFLKGGFIGVDIFFIISGFLITNFILERLNKGEFIVYEFYLRRIYRIFPALIIVITFSIIFGYLILNSKDFSNLGKNIFSTVIFLQNYFLISEISNFDPQVNIRPLLHLWSLAIEIQFYLSWPLLILFLFRYKLSIPKVLIFLILISFLYNFFYLNPNSPGSYLFSHARIWEIFIGCFLVFLKPFINKKNGFFNYFIDHIFILGICLIIFSAFLFDRNLNFSSSMLTIPILGVVLIILVGNKSRLSVFFFMNPPILWFGMISYSLYLWHWPILAFINNFYAFPTLKLKICCFFMSIFLAWLTYQFIEKPFKTRSITNYKTNTLLLIHYLLVFTGILIFTMKN